MSGVLGVCVCVCVCERKKGEVCIEGLGLDCNPLVLVRNNPAQSGTNNVTGTHTLYIVSLTH